MSSNNKQFLWKEILFVALAMSLGWGIRGNFGHETGAMIPGVLGAMASVLIAGRKDWLERITFVSLFGAIGWAFGGQSSYGMVLGYTLDNTYINASYGFASTFALGMLWGIVGGGIMSLALVLSKEKLEALFIPFIVVFAFWLLSDAALIIGFGDTEPNFLYYYDTDWLAVARALIAVLLLIAYQKKITEATSLFLHITLGWFAGLLVLVTLLNLHMTPPRSDNWAGMFGVAFALLLYLYKNKYPHAIKLALTIGIFSGIGFSMGQLFHALGLFSKIALDWWKIMEQSFGFIAGIGIALAVLNLRNHVPVKLKKENFTPWKKHFSIFFILVVITYLNFSSLKKLLKSGVIDPNYLGHSPYFWFNWAYVLIAILVIYGLYTHNKRTLFFIPTTDFGKSQLYFLLFLTIVVFANQIEMIGSLHGKRLIVEGSFFITYLGIIGLLVNQTKSNYQPPTILPPLHLKKTITTMLITWLIAGLLFSAVALQFNQNYSGGTQRFPVTN